MRSGTKSNLLIVRAVAILKLEKRQFWGFFLVSLLSELMLYSPINILG
jgi:hypothetical protein